MKAGSSPTQISLAELTSNGPGGNVYFTVTGIEPSTGEYVAEETATNRMTKVWIPCVPVESTETPKFILYSTTAPTEADVDGLMLTDTHTGMIINDITGLGREEKDLLRSSLPEIDPDDAYIFEVNRTPAGFLKYTGLMRGGLVLVVGGGAWILLVHE